MPEQDGTPQQKGLSHYFGNKKWWQITREERFFCQHLYSKLQTPEGLDTFINFIKEKTKIDLSAEEWEPAYEVCFYRDLSLYAKKNGIDLPFTDTKENVEKETDRPAENRKKMQKRTFDLCLFSENTIVIIEAKAQQGFYNSQLESFDEDRKWIQETLGIRCLIFGLVSSVYASRLGKQSFIQNWPFDSNSDGFEDNGFKDYRFHPGKFGLLLWGDLANEYNNDQILERADTIYQDGESKMSGAEILEAYFEEPDRNLFVGREKGLNGARFQEDIESGIWRKTNYPVSRTDPHNKNWFTLEEFVSETIKLRDGTAIKKPS